MDTVKALWLAGVKDDRICEQTQVKPGTLKTWINRYSWNSMRVKVRESLNAGVIQVVGESLERQSNAVRRSLGSAIEQASDAIASESIKASRLGTNGGKQGQAAIIKTLAEGAEKVFGWSTDSKSTVTLAMFFNSGDPALPQAIEIEATVTPQAEPVEA